MIKAQRNIIQRGTPRSYAFYQQCSGIDILGIKSFDNKRKLTLEMKIAKLILVREGLITSIKEVKSNKKIISKELSNNLLIIKSC